jgi:hypothetical protein
MIEGLLASVVPTHGKPKEAEGAQDCPHPDSTCRKKLIEPQGDEDDADPEHRA